MPVEPGSVTLMAAAAATAASCAESVRSLEHDTLRHTAALPPFLRISIPAVDARGCVLDTMPFVLCTTDRRLGKWTNWGSGWGYTLELMVGFGSGS
jgi:hypothetical protein